MSGDLSAIANSVILEILFVVLVIQSAEVIPIDIPADADTALILPKTS
jgi:hypothetical protein